ncbi:hypothetical protein [Phosphitispora sp. TUW77]|uniref:hypothetical protein n=1 Tax=Phosphitispora sp. TUW77 TaxID=3152361 RepID=UPI003AB16B7B
MIWIVRCNNAVVTDFYLDIVGTAMKRMTADVCKVDGISNIKNGKTNDYYFVARLVDALKLLIRGRKNIIFWVQGVEPEESYMRHKKLLRKIILEKIERYILKNAKFVFFISFAMQKHYEIKYGIDFVGRNYVMPCFNTNIHKEAFFKEGKYINNVFVYVGSLSVWQRFDEVVTCFKNIEEFGIPNCKLLVLTKEINAALDVLKKLEISSYEVCYVNNDDLPNVIADAKFGFVIRDDVIVNRVATPTKISTYLSSGVIPIYSSCLEDFHNVSVGMRYKQLYDTDNFQKEMYAFMKQKINNKDVYKEYNNLFSTYYNVDFHINNIISCVKELLK